VARDTSEICEVGDRRVRVTPSGPQPGDVDTAETHMIATDVGPMWSSPTPVWEHVTRHSETQGPAPGEAAGGNIPVSLRGFSDKHSSTSRPMWSSRDHTARRIVLILSKVTQSRLIRKFLSPLEKNTQVYSSLWGHLIFLQPDDTSNEGKGVALKPK